MTKYWRIIKKRWSNSPNKKLFVYWLILRFKKLLKIDFKNDCLSSSQEPIDIVIPTISKDYLLLEIVLSSLKNLCQPINKIFIVSQPNDFIKNFCQEHHCQFIDERSVLGYGKEVINYMVDGLDRSGWLFQQLLKLSGEKFVEKDNYFVLDSDTVLLNCHSLIDNNKFVFFENEEWHEPYFKSFQKIFGYSTRNHLSFTSHMMIFNIDYLKEMKTELEKKHGQTWDLIYRSTINQREESCISDYDTYANWLLINHSEKIIKKPLYNRSLKQEKLKNLENLQILFGKKYNSISFHSYYLKEREEIIKETN